MGSLIYLPDINEDEMARKVVMHKRHGGGLEAPRNSMELPIETSYGLYAARDNILYAHHMTKESSGEDYYSTEAPIKKLICEEISKRPSARSKSPSVVARLMGVDVLPFESKPGAQLTDIRNGSPMDKLMDKNLSKKVSVSHIISIPKSNCSQQLEVDPIGHYVDGYPYQFSSRMKSNRPKPREHPQEEELQKFKQEFEVWQAARFNKCSNFVKFNSPPPELLAQKELNREKMYRYATCYRTTKCESLREHDDLSEQNDSCNVLDYERVKKKNLHYSDEGKESLHPNRGIGTYFRASQLMNSGQALDIVSAPSKIVVLRPGPDTTNIIGDSWGNTPSTSEEVGTIENFLEEVKERLESELQGKCSKRSTTVRGRGIETPYWEKPSKSREIAQCIAQEVRDSVSRDLGMNLPRSQSTRSYRSEIQNGIGSPEFINRDTRKFLAERLRNVLKGERHREAVHTSSTFSMSDFEKGKPGHLRSTWTGNKMSHHDSFTNELQKRSCSFREEPDQVGMPHQTDMSPRNLVRSLSTPVSVSGRSFGNLLLEDRHVLTGAQIRRKHEATDKVSMNIKKQKKDKFNIREKVSSFRYNLTLRARLFRRRVKSMERSGQNKNNLLKDIPNGPTATMSFFDTHGNSTEVPPSPASVCSSVHDEFWRSNDYLSPISSSGGHQLEDSDVSNVFREINSNLNELRRKLDQFEGACLEETIHEPHAEVETNIEDQSEAYVRDLLIAAGLYDDSFSRSLSKWNPLGKPISSQVFEEVEETYKESSKVKDHAEKINHRMIVDLLNEVLPSILREPVNISRYMEKAIGVTRKSPNGRMLLSQVWNSIRVYVHPPVDRCCYALDNVLALDLKSTPWSRLIDEDVNALSRDIECLIVGDMIEEMVKDMHS
ncbi:uncharacterized protein LOC131023790 [Salvia miltiorrhiza]|uniref:uncharacterized protein LOC131023790 n=1 Tax=Salvia miltiorrhiza TaxID=226208 RepID=UPI0025AB75E6|nr:uncharacterized protein LOC131023790 [Salvia miltiorrhiza]XP_057809364.1 uncharacterized protein LOC131023790 [Salvia miltiorrhiza]XP_057809365.1 uncharacterized protein LOC131023790 [Salvia miltiorrhiza]